MPIGQAYRLYSTDRVREQLARRWRRDRANVQSIPFPPLTDEERTQISFHLYGQRGVILELASSEVARLLSSEHFSVDGTLLEAWASLKSFRPKDGSGRAAGCRSKRRARLPRRGTHQRHARLDHG